MNQMGEANSRIVLCNQLVALKRLNEDLGERNRFLESQIFELHKHIGRLYSKCSNSMKIEKALQETLRIIERKIGSDKYRQLVDGFEKTPTEVDSLDQEDCLFNAMDIDGNLSKRRRHFDVVKHPQSLILTLI
eukprot:TRINITY_DN6120_c0_g3_i1.p1 TRINITY_DN6120_c0_g3~~TRINITY_DN6120_c0_g3_i1.p1  ORF type:complete len:133 (-),score=19.82 TRINITY_DN6120_c0_g3_i1:340-738(-)